jgi:flagellar biosynthesis protein FlhB
MWAGKSCCSFIAAFIAALLQHSCVLIYKSVHPSGRDIAALSQIYCSFITAHTDTIYKILGSDIAALSQIYCSFITAHTDTIYKILGSDIAALSQILSQLYCRVGICHICRFLSFDIATLSQLYRDFYCSIGRILKRLPTGCGHGGGNPLLVGRVMWEA